MTAPPPVILTIPGPPVAQPRAKIAVVGGIVRKYISRTRDRVTGQRREHPIHAYKQRITLAAKATGWRSEGPVVVALRFYMPVPQDKRKRIGRGDPGLYRELLTRRPDVDNLAKAVLDALSGVAFADDSQVVRLEIEKFNALEPRTEIEVKAMEGVGA